MALWATQPTSSRCRKRSISFRDLDVRVLCDLVSKMNRIVAWSTVLLLCLSGSAFAQPAPSPEEVQQAQARWGEGKAFFDSGNYESARLAFKQAYMLFQHPAFLQNLGEAELRCGRQVDAARHLSQFIRSANGATPAQRDAAKKSLKKASEKLGVVVVETNTDDAEVRVDDDVIGRSPLGALQWFVEPGAHAVSARKEGYLDGTEKVDVAIGPPKNVFVKLQRVIGGADDAKADPSQNSNPAQGVSTGAIDSSVASNDSKGTSVQPRTIVLIGGAGLAVGALGLGVYYAAKVHSDNTHIDDLFAPVGGDSATTCATPSTATKEACAALVTEGPQLQRDRNARTALLLAGGVLGAATVATFFLWPARAPRSTAVLPDVGPGRGGVVVVGRF